MRSPRERYQNDPEYRLLVQTLESFIHQARFTPSELREAAVLASINYEINHYRGMVEIDPDVMAAFGVLDRYTITGDPK